jgi:hypothetical protein
MATTNPTDDSGGGPDSRLTDDVQSSSPQHRVEAPDELPASFDEPAIAVLLLAAHIGAQISDDVFVSYTTLLLGVLLAKLDQRETLLGSGVKINELPAWQTEASGSIHIDAILDAKGIAKRTVVKLSEAIRNGSITGWPKGRPLLSVSARGVLDEAAAIATRSRGKTADVLPVDIMESFLFRVPASHGAQLSEWGLTAQVAQRIGVLLTRQPPAHSDATPRGNLPDLPGFDPIVSAVLRLAASFTQGHDNPAEAIDAITVLVAAVRLTEVTPNRTAPELIMLNEALEADVPGTPFASLCAGYSVLGPSERSLGSIEWRKGNWPPRLQMLLDGAERCAASASDWRPSGGSYQLSRPRPTIVAARHLVFAFLTVDDGVIGTTVGDIVPSRIASPQQMRDQLLRLVAADHPSEDLTWWQSQLAERDPQIITVARADTIPDDPRTADTLGLRRFADAMGALITASDQKPPLSIAVFGSWGSGKSFFMAMIRAAVRDFERAGKAAFAAQSNTPFLRRVVQIEFNAWHYADGNLWASLVHAILEELQRSLTPTLAGSDFQTLLNQLQMKQAVQLEAEARLRDAEHRLAEAQAAQGEAEEAAARRRRHEHAVPTTGDVLRAVQEETLQALRPNGSDADARAWITSVGESVSKAADYLGRPELAAQVPALQKAANGGVEAGEALQVQVGQIEDLLDEARASVQRGGSMVGWLVNSRMATEDRNSLVIICCALVTLLLMLAFAMEHWGSGIAAAASAIAAFVAPITAVLAASMAWARRHLSTANRAFAVLGSLRDRVDEDRNRRLAERDAALLAARRATSDAEAEATRRKAEVEVAAVAVRQAEADRDAATSPEQLRRFVAQRLAEGDYQRHLGLIHTIRADLERLGGILRDVHPGGDGSEAPVQRIVLYIDDLDRCPPLRVVEVLEAVHLLLAFPLFVVVVGVDIRWVSQALRERYPSQLGNAPGVASPTDYLEKVFQIPFWLPPMDAPAARKLLESAIGQAEPTVQAPAAVVATLGTDGSAAPGEVTATTANAPAEGKLDDASASTARAASAIPGTPDPIPDAARPRTTVDARATAEALVLYSAERERLLSLAAAVGSSPRRANRFANLYRLLKASLSPEERRRFVLKDGTRGSYPGALILLAAATGAPHAARTMIDALAAMTGPEGNDAKGLHAVLEAATAAAVNGEQAAFAAARADMERIDGADELMRHLRLWAPRVRRFVFDGAA